MIKLKKEKITQTEISLTPMLDVIFILLIFFLLTATTAHTQIPLILPETETSENQESKDSQDLIISLDIHNTIYINGKQTNLSQVEKIFEKEGQNYQNIILEGDQQAHLGIFIRILDLARKYNLSQFAIKTEPLQGDQK